MKTPISKRLEDLMRAHGMNEFEVSKRSGLHQPTVHRILSGESKSPRLSNLAQLAKVFDVSIQYLTADEFSQVNVIAENNSEYDSLTPAASKLIKQIKSLSSAEINEEDYLLVSKILERLSSTTPEQSK
jgi:transcriptional regulator with XRE-family HTH domain